MNIKRTFVAAAIAAALSLTGGMGIAGAAHTHVDNPSGCHETNGNARTGAERSGNTSWTNSAGGHERAAANGAHEAGGC